MGISERKEREKQALREKIITAGRVKVNGQVVTELGTKVDPARVQITVDNKPIKRRNRFVYYKIYKPRGMLSDMGGDTGDHRTVAELLPKDSRRVFGQGEEEAIRFR